MHNRAIASQYEREIAISERRWCALLVFIPQINSTNAISLFL